MPMDLPVWMETTVGKRTREGADSASTVRPRRGGGDASDDREKVRKELTVAGVEGDLKKVLGVLTTLALQHDGIIADLVGATFRTFLMPWESGVIKAVKAATAGYAEQAKRQGRDHGLGPPFLHAWGALLKALAQGKLSDRAKKTIEAYWNGVVCTVKDLEQLADAVKHCRVSKTHDPKQAKLQFAVALWRPEPHDPRDLTLEEALLAALAEQGGQRRNGAPPKSALARDAQRILDLLRPSE